jgi:hypothetical protein
MTTEKKKKNISRAFSLEGIKNFIEEDKKGRSVKRFIASGSETLERRVHGVNGKRKGWERSGILRSQFRSSSFLGQAEGSSFPPSCVALDWYL